METAQYLDSIRRDGSRIRELSSGDLAADVVTCPGWTMADLLDHVARVFTMVADVLATGRVPDRLGESNPAAQTPAAYSRAFDRLVETMELTNLDAERWNWSVGPQRAGFWWRRMAQETAVHRWDAESAYDVCRPIDTELAADGIDEWFDVHVRSDVADPENAGDASGTISVSCADVGGEWWASLADRHLELDRSRRQADVALRGNASDLLLVLWRRTDPSAVETLGDEAVLRSWLALADI